jgi:hypothetical protein
MTDFEKPTYVVDLSHRMTCSLIGNAVPGRNMRIQVKATAPDGPGSDVRASGELTGDQFEVTVTRGGGRTQCHGWGYSTLLAAIAAQEHR